MGFRNHLTRLIDARMSKSPERMMDDEVLELIDLSREEDLDSRLEEDSPEEDNEIKEVDELAMESSSLTPKSKPATDSAIFNSSREIDASETPDPEVEPGYEDNSVKQALATEQPRDVSLVPDAQAEQLTQSDPDNSETFIEVPEHLEPGFNEMVEAIEQDLRLKIDKVSLYEQEAMDPTPLLPEIPESFYDDGQGSMYQDSSVQMAWERRS